MMTRKDYVAVSRILKNYKHEMEEEAYSNLCNDFADYMENDNPRFQDLKFLQACEAPTMLQTEYASPKSASEHVSLA